jgi:hypothetical protein
MSEDLDRLLLAVINYGDNFIGIVVKSELLLSDRWESIGMVWKSDQ